MTNKTTADFVEEGLAAERAAAEAVLNRPEPPPAPSTSRPVWELVIEDMRQRDQFGRAKYGTPLQADNGRDHLVDAYQEALDLAVYLRAEIERRNSNEPPALTVQPASDDAQGVRRVLSFIVRHWPDGMMLVRGVCHRLGVDPDEVRKRTRTP